MAADGSIAYRAFTAQDKPLNEHTTAYVNTISDVTAALAVTGGQVTYFDGGARFTRSGGYDPVEVSVPNDTGLVNYAGTYIGLSNVNRGRYRPCSNTLRDLSIHPPISSFCRERQHLYHRKFRRKHY